MYARIRLHLKSDTVSARTVTFSTEAGGTILKSGDGAAFPSPFTLNINGAFRVVEAWTYNAGTTVYLKYLGEFT